MQELSSTVIQMDDKEYFLVDSIQDAKNVYHYFGAVEDMNDLCVLKDKEENGEPCYASLDTENEFNYALGLFYKKHKNSVLDSK